jgi:hypothetical protein
MTGIGARVAIVLAACAMCSCVGPRPGQPDWVIVALYELDRARSEDAIPDPLCEAPDPSPPATCPPMRDTVAK